MKRFGEKLRALRTERGLSYRQIADILDIHFTYINKIEMGKRRPPANLIFKIAKFFGVSTDQLMDDELEL
ncbi:helix-turn-helix transcriptional regulator [Anaerolineales bacterium HSG24]|nr:helix-turn-helix transcriptional regulator [Anaerolineales bacterium HSG24]